MNTGAPPVTRLENALQNLKIRVAVARRMPLDHSNWDFDLVSPFWRLYVQNRPGASISFESRRLDLDERHIFLVPAWLRFQTSLTCPVLQDYVHFYLYGIPPALQRRLFDRAVAIPLTPMLRALVSQWQIGLCRRLEDFGLAEYCWTNAVVQATMAELFSRLPAEGQQEYFRSFAADTPVQAALARIEASLANPPDNRQLAALCNLSEDHFIRLFRTFTGSTPAQYGLDRRVDLAAELLADTRRSIKDIAAASGFVDRFHFSKVIKARLGLPPAEYRRQLWNHGE